MCYANMNLSLRYTCRSGNECGTGLGESTRERRVCASSREGKEVMERVCVCVCIAMCLCDSVCGTHPTATSKEEW